MDRFQCAVFLHEKPLAELFNFHSLEERSVALLTALSYVCKYNTSLCYVEQQISSLFILILSIHKPRASHSNINNMNFQLHTTIHNNILMYNESDCSPNKLHPAQSLESAAPSSKSVQRLFECIDGHYFLPFLPRGVYTHLQPSNSCFTTARVPPKTCTAVYGVYYSCFSVFSIKYFVLRYHFFSDVSCK